MSADLPAAPSSVSDLASCVSYYTSLDLNKNGLKDWVVVEGTSGETLVPADPDLDGDGIPNVFDAKPMTRDVGARVNGREIPAHLAMDGERGRLQREIYEKVGVLAIDHTDRHALVVLEAFRDVAVRALSPGFEKKAPSLRFLYAFKGHDSRVNIAAYHREMNALSIGGESSWSRASSEDRVRLLAAVAHETGHAFLFDRMTPEELAHAGSRFGDWSNVVAAAHARAGNESNPGGSNSVVADRIPAGTHDPKELSFHDERFLKRPHPFKKLARLARGNDDDLREFMNRSVWSSSNIVSRYSTTNVHEWFADAFAADVLNRLGERGLIPASTGGDWKKSLTIVPRNGAFWANYNNVSPSFRMWMKAKLDSVTRASVIDTRTPASR